MSSFSREDGTREQSKVASSAGSNLTSNVVSIGAAFRHGDTVPVRMIALDAIAENPYQTRATPSDESLEELVASIRTRGLLQPILVREVEDEQQTSLLLVAGQRRLRAAQIAGLTHIPAIVHRLDDQQALEYTIIENAQREDLNPVEEAEAYHLLIDSFGLTQSEVAAVTGKHRTTIANALRLLRLDPRVLELLRSQEVTAGHARALLQFADPAMQYQIARRIVLEGLSVRAVERMAAHQHSSDEPELEGDEELLKAQLERQQKKVQEYLELETVQLSLDKQGRRRLHLTFESDAAWKRFISRIRS